MNILAQSIVPTPASDPPSDPAATTELRTVPRPRNRRRIRLEDWVARFFLGDLAVVIGSGLAPTWVGNRAYPELFWASFLPGQIEAIGVAAVIFAVVARLGRLYRARRVLDARQSFQRASMALVATFGLLMTLAAATKTTDIYSRLWFFSWMVLCFVALLGYRAIALARLHASMRRGRYVCRALSVGVGCPPLAGEAISTLGAGLTQTVAPISMTSMSQLGQLPEHIRQLDLDQVYVRVPWDLVPHMEEALRELQASSADVFLVPELPDAYPRVIRAATLQGSVSLQVLDRPIDGWNYWLKRIQDLAIATLSLAALSPFLLMAALAIKLESQGPVLFRQRRMGFNGQIFEIWKFRTMYANVTDADANQQTARNDARVTRVGRFLRRTSIDELPQLVNVIQGRMSIVGPRPHALKTTAGGQLLADAIDDYAARHRVKPGITGLAQVNGFRGELQTVEQLRRRIEYDLKYIDDWSVWLDMRIVVTTLLHVLGDPHAY